MTPEQKELKVEAFRAFINKPSTMVRYGWAQSGHSYYEKPASELNAETWINPESFIRLAPPAEIPYHNPEGVTQEQLGEGWRFLLKEEISATSDQNWCSIWAGKGWSENNSAAGTLRYYTYRTRKPLPAKYQHLVPESEEARARRLFADLKAPEGYGEPEYLGIGPVEIEEGYYYASLIRHRSDSQWCFSPNFNGLSEGGFYARARKISTEKEKAEAALNAYKLEPGESLVHRGDEWLNGECRTSFLYYDLDEDKVYRHNHEIPNGAAGYYGEIKKSEIIKETELVPFTQETWPLGAIVKHPSVEIPCVVLSHDGGGILLNQSTRALPYETLHKDGWVYTTNQGDTWSLCGRIVTRAGKGVGA